MIPYGKQEISNEDIVAPEDDEMLVVLAVCERCSILFRPELLPSVTLI